MDGNNLETFTEVFPVNLDSMPTLYAYALDIHGGDRNKVGGKLSYRFRKQFPGHWVWTCSRIVTDSPQEEGRINDLLKQLWQEHGDIYGALRAVRQDNGWHPLPQAQADFIAYGLLDDLLFDIKTILDKHKKDLEAAYVERVFEKRGWVIQGEPAVSISMRSRLVYKQTLDEYAKTLGNVNDLKGLWVADRNKDLKGEIIDVGGSAKGQRERLLLLTQDPVTKEAIEQADDESPTVSVQVGRSSYEYVLNALRIIVRNHDFKKFRINSKQALNTLRIEPSIRASIVNEISQLAIDRRILLEPYNSNTHPNRFLSPDDVGFVPSLLLGGGNKVPLDRSLWYKLLDNGIYKPSAIFNNRPIQVAILNALGSVSISDFCSSLKQNLNQIGFEINFVLEEKASDSSREELERAISVIQGISFDIILAFFPDECSEEDEEYGTYYHFKSLTVGQGIASQLVYKSTLSNKYALGNIILGVLGKTGNIPFILSEPLSYADLVVGIDIARERKKRLPGSMNATAIARIYFSDGEFLRYVIHDSPLEGETIPDNVLKSLFPASEFQGKKVVVQRDGYFRGDEKQALKNWAQKIGAKFYLVEVIKTGTPRIYAKSGGRTHQPIKGIAFKLSDNEAFLVSTLPPFQNATPQPLHIRTEKPFTIEQAIHSILSLTLLHYGSLRPPRLPVTIHYSDRISYLALRGIKPKNLEGTMPFWL